MSETIEDRSTGEAARHVGPAFPHPTDIENKATPYEQKLRAEHDRKRREHQRVAA